MRLLFIFLIIICASVGKAQQLPYKHHILQNMVLANKYFMDKWPDPTKAIVTDKTRPSNLWTRATYYEGLMQLYNINRDTTFYKYAVDWATFHKWEPTYGGTTARNADYFCCGQTYIELYQLDNKVERIQKIKACADYMIGTTEIRDWWWIDAFQMAMPVFAKLGAIYNNNTYYERMYAMYNYTKTKPKGIGLFNTTDNMWWRDSTFCPPTVTSNGKQVYWSRGNGWVMTALARVLDVMPVGAPHRDEYVNTFKQIAPAMLAIQRTDGFWNPSLDDVDDFGGKETSGTAMFTFSFAWGIRNGLLDSATYFPSVVKGWNAMVQDALHANGMLGYVQGTGKEPKDGQPLSYDKAPNFEDYGLGAFLLAGSEVYKLASDSIGTVTAAKSLKSNIQETSIIAFPNPFRNSVTITYNLPSESIVDVYVTDCFGKKVNSLLKKSRKTTGSYSVVWNGLDNSGNSLSEGIYIVSLKTGKTQKQVKIELLK